MVGRKENHYPALRVHEKPQSQPCPRSQGDANMVIAWLRQSELKVLRLRCLRRAKKNM
jgi:hypothetical protein